MACICLKGILWYRSMDVDIKVLNVLLSSSHAQGDKSIKKWCLKLLKEPSAKCLRVLSKCGTLDDNAVSLLLYIGKDIYNFPVQDMLNLKFLHEI